MHLTDADLTKLFNDIAAVVTIPNLAQTPEDALKLANLSMTLAKISLNLAKQEAELAAQPTVRLVLIDNATFNA